MAFGFTDFPLIAYHFAKAQPVGTRRIAVLYALALGSSSMASLPTGRLFDRIGLIVLIPVTVAAAIFAPLVFLGGLGPALVGALLCGSGLGLHESTLARKHLRDRGRHHRSS